MMKADAIGADEIEAVRAASRGLVRELGFMRRALPCSGLSAAATHALIELGRDGPMTAAALGRRLRMDKGAVSRMAATLRQRGAVDRAQAAGDRRAALLRLTASGRAQFEAIDRDSARRVGDALGKMTPDERRMLGQGLTGYRRALEGAAAAAPSIRFGEGYAPGIAGWIARAHVERHPKVAAFGPTFEARVASGVGAFLLEDAPQSRLFWARDQRDFLASIAIDGRSQRDGAAQLRWFVAANAASGRGLGGALLARALAFADRRGFAKIRLTTYEGLDAARALYERSGFVLADQRWGEQWGGPLVEQIFVREAGRDTP